MQADPWDALAGSMDAWGIAVEVGGGACWIATGDGGTGQAGWGQCQEEGAGPWDRAGTAGGE